MKEVIKVRRISFEAEDEGDEGEGGDDNDGQ